jgi:phage gp29-like protein
VSLSANLLSFHTERERRFGNFARVAVYRSIVDPAVAKEVARMFNESREPLVREHLATLQARGLIRTDADLPALAHVLSTLSFALASNDQLVFRKSPRALKRAITAAAGVFALGLRPEE